MLAWIRLHPFANGRLALEKRSVIHSITSALRNFQSSRALKWRVCDWLVTASHMFGALILGLVSKLLIFKVC
jgi:hypothetical protein